MKDAAQVISEAVNSVRQRYGLPPVENAKAEDLPEVPKMVPTHEGPVDEWLDRTFGPGYSAWLKRNAMPDAALRPRKEEG